MVSAALFIAGSYLWGAIPTAYLVSRYQKGIDIRRVGTGTVGSANVAAHVGKLAGLFVVGFDCVAKGTIPVVLANVLGQSTMVQAGVGLAAIAAHNWSPYLRFTGGRGVATAVGVIAGFVMWQELIALALIGLLGRLVVRDIALWTFVALALLPVLAYLFGRQVEVIYLTLLIGLLLILKRMTANWQLPRRDYSLLPLLANRILWDRDVARRADWIELGAQSGEHQASGGAEEELA